MVNFMHLFIAFGSDFPTVKFADSLNVSAFTYVDQTHNWGVWQVLKHLCAFAYGFGINSLKFIQLNLCKCNHWTIFPLKPVSNQHLVFESVVAPLKTFRHF